MSRKRWALTERGRPALHRDAASIAVGPSRLAREGDGWRIDLDEVTVPWPSRIRGRVRLHPERWCDASFPLDAAGRHAWRPLAPCARVEVELDRPALRWSGSAYADSNRGDEPLETAFARWTWSRSALVGGETAVLYDVEPRMGPPRSLALRFGPDGGVEPFAPPPRAELLPGAVWRVPRATRSDPGGAASVRRTLEDTPFYTRSVVGTRLLGQDVDGVHESLSLDRFRRGWVQTLLPFRMPRRRGSP